MAPSFDYALRIGSTGNDIASGIATDQSGCMFVVGQFSGTVDFNPTVEHNGNVDVLAAVGSVAAMSRWLALGEGMRLPPSVPPTGR